MLKRGQARQDVAVALKYFLRWAGGPLIRDVLDTNVLGMLKVRLSTDGFHYRMRTLDGDIQEDYFAF